MDLEEHSIEPVIQRTCAECGTELTQEEIRAALDSDGPFLCQVHAIENLPMEEENEPGGPAT